MKYTSIFLPTDVLDYRKINRTDLD